MGATGLIKGGPSKICRPPKWALKFCLTVSRWQQSTILRVLPNEISNARIAGLSLACALALANEPAGNHGSSRCRQACTHRWRGSTGPAPPRRWRSGREFSHALLAAVARKSDAQLALALDRLTGQICYSGRVCRPMRPIFSSIHGTGRRGLPCCDAQSVLPMCWSVPIR